MAPEDEAAFLAFVFERSTAYLIPTVRSPTAEVPRTLEGVASLAALSSDELSCAGGYGSSGWPHGAGGGAIGAVRSNSTWKRRPPGRDSS